jgi:NAD(P)-dependent dehydrogenase (short-subunit alcohol dehydrogenase family)
MAVNTRSTILLIDLAIKTMDKGGNIILIGSTSSTKGRVGQAIYSASKSALNSIVESYTPILKERNININCICPSKVRTRLTSLLNPDLKKEDMIDPNEIARLILGYTDINKTGQIVYVKKGMEIF